jgi:anti-sigma B factor antagonist
MDSAGTAEDNHRALNDADASEPTTSMIGPELDVVSVRRDDDVIVALRGEVDLCTAPMLERELALGEVQSARAILVDLEHVAFMDLTGLRPLISFARGARRGRRVSITDGSPSVRRLLELTGLGAQFNVIASEPG